LEEGQMVEQPLSYQAEPRITNFRDAGACEGGMPLAQFVESRFIPNHVELKGPAGRTHYHAILKHVITPELVDRLFVPYHGEVNGRLKALSEWPYLDYVRIRDITPDHIRRLTKSATAHGYSPQTVKHIRNVISAIFNHARKEKIFSGDNPVSEVDLPPPLQKHRPGLSMAQANGILNLLESPEREIALITMTTGLKISEICALQ
jgi:integrase